MLIYSINKYLFSNYCPNLGSSESRAWPEIKASMLLFFQGVKSHGAEMREESTEAGRERKPTQEWINHPATTQCQGHAIA